MQKLTYDINDLSQISNQASNLGELLINIENKLTEKGQIVCRFIVNNMLMSENDEIKFSQVSTADITKIEVEFESPDVLIKKVIKNWLDSIPRMMNQSDKLVQNFRKSGFENNMKEFVNLVDSCHFLIESLISLRKLCRHIPYVQGTTWQKTEELTARAIAEALESFEKKDFVQLSDILEYDLGHCLQGWIETLTELEGYVQKQTFNFMG